MDELALKEAENGVMHKTVRFTESDLTQDEWWEFTVLARERRKRVGYLLGLFIRSHNKTFGGDRADQDSRPTERV